MTPASRSTRSLIERLPDPDPGLPNYLFTVSFILPLSLALFGMALWVSHLIVEAIFGSESWVTAVIGFVVGPMVKSLPAVILISFGVLLILRMYVRIKLGRKLAP